MPDPIPPSSPSYVKVILNGKAQTFEKTDTIQHIKNTWAIANGVMPANVCCFSGDTQIVETQTLGQLTQSGKIALTIITSDPTTARREVSVSGPTGKSLKWPEIITSDSTTTIQNIIDQWVEGTTTSAPSVHIFLKGKEKELSYHSQIKDLITPSNKIDLFILVEPPPTSNKELLLRLSAPNGPWGHAGLNWRNELPLSQWDGVGSDDQGNITQIYLAQKDLHKLPPELGLLEKLEVVQLIDNHLSGPIPPELSQLSNLRILYIENSQLEGPIPKEIGRLENLEEMYLSSNHLSGPIPPELKQLSKLRHLNLCDNQLSGPIPAELGQLAQLKTLYLQNNQLEGLMPIELYILSVTQLTTKLDSQNKIF